MSLSTCNENKNKMSSMKLESRSTNNTETRNSELINTNSILKDEINVVSNILLDLISFNENKEDYSSLLKQQKSSVYNISKAYTSVTIENYIQRIVKLLNFSLIELVHMLVLIDRITSNASILLNNKNVHKLIFISCFLTEKMLRDKTFEKSIYPLVFGVNSKDIQYIEFITINSLEYNLFVSESEYKEYKMLLNGSEYKIFKMSL